MLTCPHWHKGKKIGCVTLKVAVSPRLSQLAADTHDFLQLASNCCALTLVATGPVGQHLDQAMYVCPQADKLLGM